LTSGITIAAQEYLVRRIEVPPDFTASIMSVTASSKRVMRTRMRVLGQQLAVPIARDRRTQLAADRPKHLVVIAQRRRIVAGLRIGGGTLDARQESGRVKFDLTAVIRDRGARIVSTGLLAQRRLARG
jgi:hypothetical protein